jgi:hypothetical protein
MRRPIPRENEIESAVLAHWRTLGLPDTLVAAIPNAGAMRQPGLTAGLPDLLVIGGAVRFGFIELKTERGKVRPAQALFGALCERLGLAHAITSGRDEPIALLESWGVVRRKVGRAAA